MVQRGIIQSMADNAGVGPFQESYDRFIQVLQSPATKQTILKKQWDTAIYR